MDRFEILTHEQKINRVVVKQEASMPISLGENVRPAILTSGLTSDPQLDAFCAMRPVVTATASFLPCNFSTSLASG